MESALSVPDAELGLVSLDEFAEFAQRRRGRGRCELIRGEIRTMAPASPFHGEVTHELARRIGNHVVEHMLGKCYTAETGFRLRDPDDPEAPPTVRAPDLSLLSFEDAERVRGEAFGTTPPRLALETSSPSDRIGEVSRKIRWWLARGVEEVWSVDPANRTVAIHSKTGVRLFQGGEVVASSGVLPGFEVPLVDVFGDA